MPILKIETSQTGEVGVLPSYASILTDDTEAAVLTAGYLNNAVQNGASFALPCIAKVSTKESSTADYKVGWYQVTHVGANWSVVPAGSPGDVSLPTIANHIAVYTNTTGGLSDDAATAINGGNIQAGLSGTAGYLSSFPSAALKGSLRVTAVANTGDTLVTLSNALHGQASVYSIPDSGAATANFILSKTTGVQHITVGDLQVDAGSLNSGISTGGTVGLVKAFSTTATSGFIALQAANNASGNFGTTISNSTAQAQATVLTIPDIGAATGFLNASTVSAGSTPASIIITKDITLGFAALATAGKVNIQSALATAQFKIRNIMVNYSASGLSGGGGNRLIVISDGTTTYNSTGITAALLGTPINTVWGGTGNPVAGTVAQNTSSVAGAQIYAQYAGGTTDYTAGSVVITVTYERVA
jgi:hypothetical protein